MDVDKLKDRHPSTVHMARMFDYKHLPAHLQPVSSLCHDTAWAMIALLADGPELTTGLRKLLEAKDALVRAKLDTPDMSADEIKNLLDGRLAQRLMNDRVAQDSQKCCKQDRDAEHTDDDA